MDAVTTPPTAVNEPMLSYAPGSPERAEIEARLAAFADAGPIDLPCVIEGEDRMAAGEEIPVVQPHAHAEVLGVTRNSTHAEATAAVRAARAAAPAWRALSFDDRAAVLLKAADLLAGPWRSTLNGATMLGQSKTAHQAEIDAACELIDFWRFNVEFARRILAEQPTSSRGVWNRLDHRPLEGFVPCRHPVQLHRHRREPAHRARAHGQHGRLEARTHAAVRRALRDEVAAGGRPAARRDQHGHRRWHRRQRRCARRARLGGYPLHRFHAGVPDALAHRGGADRGLPHVSAAGR